MELSIKKLTQMKRVMALKEACLATNKKKSA
jgi:hypothetical protein